MSTTKKKQNFSIQDLLEELESDYNNMVKPNIMIAGKTGVGKSTLINAIFREKLAETGTGKPVTQHLKKIEKDSVPVTLFDTKGLELQDIKRAETRSEILDEIKNREKSDDIRDHIHILWYCISYESNRIEAEEIAWIREFSRKMPVILVLTQSVTDDDKFSKYLDNLNLPVVNIAKLLAKPKTILGNFEVPAYGLTNLVQLTFQVLPDQTKKAFVNAQNSDISLKVEQAKKWSMGFIASSFGVGFTPIPFSDAVVLSGMQMTLIAKITNIFGFPNSRALFQTIVTAIAGTGTATLIGRALAGNLLKLIPGIGTIAGGVINGAVASTLTTTLAFAYIKVCEKLSSVQDLTELSEQEIAEMVKAQFKKELKNKN